MNKFTDKSIFIKIFKYLKQELIDAKSFIGWRLGLNSSDSVYFYTFHRCSSTLFSKYVLRNISGLHHIDYAKKIYKAKKVRKIDFEKKGVIYGPIRLSAPESSMEYIKLVGPLSDPDFMNDKVAIFLIRDPRDILVSSYYSFRYAHSFSADKAIRKEQEEHRKKLATQTIDQYVLESVPIIKNQFEKLMKLENACDQHVIVRYEDMINNWDYFISGITKYINIKQSVIDHVYEESRPLEFENNSSHRRSGKPAGFIDKLKVETVSSLDLSLKEILERFHYV